LGHRDETKEREESWNAFWPFNTHRGGSNDASQVKARDGELRGGTGCLGACCKGALQGELCASPEPLELLASPVSPRLDKSCCDKS
jgi:hypothetical protein